MNALCLVLDRLHVGYVGAWGNAWIETAGLDQFATEAVAFDQAMIDSPWLELIYRAYWQGGHALGPAPSVQPLPARFQVAGFGTSLVTDEPAVADHPLSAGFGQKVRIPRSRRPAIAADLDRSHAGVCFRRLIAHLKKLQPPFFTWCHLSVLGSIWDAPWEYRRLYDAETVEGDDDTVAVPGTAEAGTPEDRPHDPMKLRRAYAAQVSCLDDCLATLCDWIQQVPWSEDTLIAVVSARGFPLGEHGGWGDLQRRLYSPLVHVPWLIRFPGLTAPGVRSQALVQPADLCATLAGLLPDNAPAMPLPQQGLWPVCLDESHSLRQAALIVGENDELAVRTPAWYLRAAPKPELFVKPDDRWDANDVADRCSHVVEPLGEVLLEYRDAIRSGRTADLQPIGELLLRGVVRAE